MKEVIGMERFCGCQLTQIPHGMADTVKHEGMEKHRCMVQCMQSRNDPKDEAICARICN